MHSIISDVMCKFDYTGWAKKVGPQTHDNHSVKS